MPSANASGRDSSSSPGVRMPEDRSGRPERVVTPADAISRGADYLVVGRPDHKAADPVAAARAIRHRCAAPSVSGNNDDNPPIGSMWVTGRASVEDSSPRPRNGRKVPAGLLRPIQGGAGRIRKAREELALPCLTCPSRNGSVDGGAGGGGVAAEIAEYAYAGWRSGIQRCPGRQGIPAGWDHRPGTSGDRAQRAGVRLRTAWYSGRPVVSGDGAVFRASGRCRRARAGGPGDEPRPRNRAFAGGGVLALCRERDGRDGGDGAVAFLPAKRTAIVLGSEERGIRRLAPGAVRRLVRIAMAPGRVAERIGRRGDHRLIPSEPIDITRRIGSNSPIGLSEQYAPT